MSQTTLYLTIQLEDEEMLYTVHKKDGMLGIYNFYKTAPIMKCKLF